MKMKLLNNIFSKRSKHMIIILKTGINCMEISERENLYCIIRIK